MRKTLISYSLEKEKKALVITRKIYGYKDASNNGAYSYDRPGLLTNVPYEKLSRCTFMIEPKDKEEVVKKFKELKIKFKVADIDLESFEEFTKKG
jgi:hypothetical protein